MNKVLKYTFGGLSLQYYLRQLFFGCLFFFFIMAMAARSPSGISVGMGLICFVNTLLYPYSRFVYESVIKFFMGENIFIVNAFLMLFLKLMTMALCWSFGIFIAPLGLLYLYFHHSRTPH